MRFSPHANFQQRKHGGDDEADKATVRRVVIVRIGNKA